MRVCTKPCGAGLTIVSRVKRRHVDGRKEGRHSLVQWQQLIVEVFVCCRAERGLRMIVWAPICIR
eukprot:COSAG05_NODE_944_length_6488_cov_11.788073_5_plen_65_part_00